jgi:hypothetical protein
MQIIDSIRHSDTFYVFRRILVCKTFLGQNIEFDSKGT